MKNDWKDGQLVNEFGRSLGGVFSISDLSNLLAEHQRTSLYRRIDRLVALGVLSRFVRGFYVVPGFLPEVLSQRLAPDSYLSFGRVLSDALVIGSRPDFQLDAVKLGRTRTYSNGELTIRQFGCARSAFFGFETRKGICVATPEKALIDSLYFHQHGAVFHFDLYSDLNLEVLDRARITELLRRYDNPRFVRFVEGFLA